MFNDKKLICQDCQQHFTFTAGEQEYLNRLAEEGKFDHEDPETGEMIQGTVQTPKRCKACRMAKKARFENKR